MTEYSDSDTVDAAEQADIIMAAQLVSQSIDRLADKIDDLIEAVESINDEPITFSWAEVARIEGVTVDEARALVTDRAKAKREALIAELIEKRAARD